jgi:hypothetical protein
MIDILPNGAGNGSGAINISGCILHPQQTQNGININSGATVGFGTIGTNAFVGTNLTTGEKFLANGLSPFAGAYSEAEAINFDIGLNQGIPNSTAGVLMTVNNNGTNTSIASPSVDYLIDTGGLNVINAFVRWSVTAAGRATYIGSKDIYVSIHATINYTKIGGGSNVYEFSLFKNGVKESNSIITTDSSNSTSVLTFSYGLPISNNDYIEFYVQNTVGVSDILIEDWQIVIRE